MKTAALLAFLLPAAAAAPAVAGTASLVTDLQTSSFDAYGSSPRQLMTVGRKVFFSAGAPEIGRELWVSDGTAAGTRLLGDLCPGDCSSDPEPVAALGGMLLFVATPDDSGPTLLWRSDGTRAGTVPLTAGGEPLPVGRPNDGLLTAVASGRLFFPGCTRPAGCEPWSTDGTQAGTRIVEDLVPGEDSSFSSGFTAAGGKVFFSARVAGELALWTTGPGGLGATRVRRISESARSLAAAGNRLFFVAPTESEGEELWVSDGTAAGTRAVSSFQTPSPFASPVRLRALGDRVYFVADDVLHGEEIWASDGTAAGTLRVTDFGFNEPFQRLFDGTLAMTLLGSRLLFVATDGLTSLKLWKTDGSPETTAAVADVQAIFDTQLVKVGSRVIFGAEVPVRGRDLWSTDGTAAGTVSLTEGCHGACDNYYAEVTPLAGAAFFVGQDRKTLSNALWRTDGTPAGTRRITGAERYDLFQYGERPEIAALGSELLFAGHSQGEGNELWASDGTPASTRLVADLVSSNPSSWPRQLTPLNDGLLFVGCGDNVGGQVWHTHGAPGDAVQVSSASSSNCDPSSSSETDRLTVAGGRYFFLRWENLYDPQLWTSDGTPGGTVQLTHFGDDNNPVELVPLGSRVVFPVYPGQLWASDGTSGGTGPLVTLPAGTLQIHHLRALGGEVFFIAATPDDGEEVWRTDGTPAGTYKITAFPGEGSLSDLEAVRVGPAVFFTTGGQLLRSLGAAGDAQVVALAEGFYQPRGLAAFAGKLFFFASGTEYQRSLWRVEASGSGLTLVADLGDSPYYDVVPDRSAVFANRLYFTADDGVHGREPWASDGTPAGTAMVRDLFSGASGSRPDGFTVAGGRLFFAAYDGIHGRELWQTDGTAAGTRLVQDVAPEALSSSPTEITAAGDRLYWSAEDGLHGRELWALPLSGPASCQPSPTRLCLGNGRFAVEADWKDFQGHTGAGRAVALTADTGYFWFFNEANVEVILKVLDARGLNDHFWVFYGALSSVSYSLKVTDTTTGLSRRYSNPSGQLASVADTTGFGPLGAYGSTYVAPAAPAGARLVSARTAAAAPGVCVPSSTRLCLNNGRFAVEATWKDFQGHTGAGQAVALTGDTGYFWFFNADNVEVVLKVLDARPLNGKFWVFYGALSSVEYALTVTDVQTGATRTYKNESGRLASAADTGAF